MVSKGLSAGLAAVLAAGLALAGCATQAMRQSQALTAGAAAANTQMSACLAKVQASPSWAVVATRVPANAGQPTLQQLADTSYADDQQITAVFALNAMMQDCRKPLLTAYTSMAPGVGLVIMDSFQKSDQEALLLVQKKISWGEYNKAMQLLADDAAKSLTAEGQKINSQLAQENADEMAQRQRAAEALMQYSLQEQAIAAANRPVTTNCNAFGNSVNCVTH